MDEETRKQHRLRKEQPCPVCGGVLDDTGDGVVTCGKCGHGMGGRQNKYVGVRLSTDFGETGV